ncbi:MAG: outer membrane lipoprotein-sorting protein [Sulfurimonas sp.]|nr:outer membrane lipoprotein-sorting protein [Sulfurimonas sp.]
MKKILLLTTLTIVLFGESSMEIAKKSYENMSGYKDSISINTMILKNAQGVENIRKLEIKKLESSDGDKTLVGFLYPIDIKDTKLLSYEEIGEDDKQWLYLPALKRVKRISSGDKSGSFMASEFSYEDISSQNYKKYSYLEEVQKIVKDDAEYFVITRVPKDKESGYLKQVLYIDTQTYLAKFGAYFDKQNRLLKEVSFLEYIKLEGVYRIKKMEMFNVQTKKSSVLTWDEDRIKVGLSEDDFSKRVLQ